MLTTELATFLESGCGLIVGTASSTGEHAPDRDYDEVLGWVPDHGAGLVGSIE